MKKTKIIKDKRDEFYWDLIDYIWANWYKKIPPLDYSSKKYTFYDDLELTNYDVACDPDFRLTISKKEHEDEYDKWLAFVDIAHKELIISKGEDQSRLNDFIEELLYELPLKVKEYNEKRSYEKDKNNAEQELIYDTLITKIKEV